MIEGKIIQFYRKLRNFTQSELSEGICSATHISKIERGLTEVSDNTILLIAERLKINLEDETKAYNSLDNLLEEWLQSIIMKIEIKADHLKQQLEEIQLLHISNFFQFYKVILTKYYLFKNNDKLAKEQLEYLNR
ncbi:helix-turn-helix domain-containing protein, partial [Gottfriedia sp. NPDC056225]|uniref:helix-turn-helix domain-containing protein n=1 Tax=Gottfriedia sp. NPDC056225 TaxID=3345751 RepID=UPI0035E2F81B